VLCIADDEGATVIAKSITSKLPLPGNRKGRHRSMSAGESRISKNAAEFACHSDDVFDRIASRYDVQDLAGELVEHGFQDVAYERLSLGIVAIHTARKPRKSAISSAGVKDPK
jgi:hypothetical protein